MSAASAIQHAIAFIKAEWKQGKSLKEIAQIFRVDAGNLARAFKDVEGVTVKEFLDRKRMEYVRTALATDLQYGYEIGEAIGFQDELAFYRWTKTAFGVSFRALCEKVRYKKQ